MEAHVQSKHQDELLPSMCYASAPTASYIESRRMVRFRPASGGRFSPSQRTIRFNLQDHCWLEPSSVRLQFQLNNLDATNALVPVAHPMSMFTNIKLYASGQIVENSEELCPLAISLDKLKPYVRRVNDSMMSHTLKQGSGHLDGRAHLPSSDSRTCICELPLGLFRSGKLIHRT